MSTFSDLCYKSKWRVAMSRMCSDHPKSACLNIKGYILDCCSDSHTTTCKYSTIVSLVGELQQLSKRLDLQTTKLEQQVEVNDLLRQRLVTFEEKQKNIGGQYLIVNKRVSRTEHVSELTAEKLEVNYDGMEPETKKRHTDSDELEFYEDITFINNLFKN